MININLYPIYSYPLSSRMEEYDIDLKDNHSYKNIINLIF